MRQSFVRCLLLVSSGLCLAHGRVVQGRGTLVPDQPFQLLSYFTFDVGTGSIEVEGGVEPVAGRAKPSIYLALIVDNEWHDALHDGTCEGMVLRSRWKAGNQLNTDRLSTKSVTQKVRPYMWYLVATSCGLQNPVSFTYKATFLNSDSSHFSFHEMPYLTLYIVLSSFCFAALFYVALVFWHKTSKSTLTHRSALQLMAALTLQASAFFLQTLHLSWYSYDGTGSYTCDVLSDICGNLSQFMVAWTLLDLTWGWFHSTIANEWKQAVVIAAMFSVFFMHMAVPVLTRSSFGSTGSIVSHHEHDSWLGLFMLIMKMGMCMAFAFGCMKTYRSEPSMQQQKFLIVFGILGIAWFVAFPVIVVIAELVPPYYQHMASTIGVVLCQMIGLTFLCVLLLSNTDYYRLITSADVLLPTSNKRH